MTVVLSTEEGLFVHCFQIKLEFAMLVFVEGTRESGEKHPEQGENQEQTLFANDTAFRIRNQGAVSRKPRKHFGPVKPLQNLEPCEYTAALVAYSRDEGRFPSYKKFQAYTLLRF